MIRGLSVSLRHPTPDDVPALVDFVVRNRDHFRTGEPARSEAYYTPAGQADLVAAGVQSSERINQWNYVQALATLARAGGIDGIVCSGEEVGGIRDLWPESYRVVPGIRPAGSALGDQKRVVTPAEARERGASMIVVGRPITDAPNPGQAAADIAASL